MLAMIFLLMIQPVDIVATADDVAYLEANDGNIYAATCYETEPCGAVMVNGIAFTW